VPKLMRAAVPPSNAVRSLLRASLRKASRCTESTQASELAGVRIDAADLATLQRNIVLSHAAGVGEPLPVNVTRLMMALKLASLGQGAIPAFNPQRSNSWKRHSRTRSSRLYRRRAL